MDRRTAVLIAEIAVDGPWSIAAVTDRIRKSVGGNTARSKWPQKLTEHIFCNADFVTVPTVRSLAKFLWQDADIERITCRAESSIARWVASVSTLSRPAPAMEPASEIARTWDVPSITTPGQLADALQIRINHLDWMADARGSEHTTEKEKLRNYRYHWISKSSGGSRLLEAPKQKLKRCQRWIADQVLSCIPPHDAAHAFRAGRSPITAASAHVNQHVVLRIDLSDFFPSIKAARVAGIFHTAGYPSKVVRLLTGLCTNTAWKGVLDGVHSGPDQTSDTSDPRYQPLFVPHLPQGSPASPALANLCAWSLDCRLAGLARKLNVRYTRYADDLVFSGNWTFGTHLRRFRILVCAICLDEGFEIRKRKTTVARQHQRQQVTGIVVNQKLAIAREDYDRLKAVLHNCIRTGPETQNRQHHPNFRAHLVGKVAWVRSIDAAKGAKLQQKLDSIRWDENEGTEQRESTATQENS